MPSITAHKPTKSVQIDRERNIRFNWQSACRFEEAFGRTIPQAMGFDIGARFITFLAWAGMLHAEPGLTIKETEKRIQAFLNNSGDIGELAKSLGEALVESGVIGRPKGAEEQKDEEVPSEEVDPTEVSLTEK